MLFQEPKMEFVPIDLSIDAESDQSQPAGLETCTGPLAPSNLCNYNNTNDFWLDENGNMWTGPNSAPGQVYTQRRNHFQ